MDDRSPRSDLAAALALAVALAAGPACSNPSIDEYEPHTGLIQGSVYYANGTARGNTLVFLYRADDPPPPDGTGLPVNFVVVPADRMFDGVAASATGPFTASYTIPTVPAGTYQLRAFLDADANFNPVADLLNEPSAGDVAGGYVDVQTKKFLPVVVENDQITPQITVSLGLTIPVERPAFAITSSRTYTVPLQGPALLQLAAHPIQRGAVMLDPQRTAFLVQPVDPSGNLQAGVYPKVVLERIMPPPDANGAVIVPGLVDPTPFATMIQAAGFALTPTLKVTLPPVSVLHGPAGDMMQSQIPPGVYQVTVISGTGQTWTVPNDLATIDPAGGVDVTQTQSIEMRAQ